MIEIIKNSATKSSRKLFIAVANKDENGMRPALAAFASLLVVALAQAEAEQDSLVEVEEHKRGHFMPENKLRNDKKRLDAIDLRKKIIAEIYKRDSNLKGTRGEKKKKTGTKGKFLQERLE